MANANQYKEEIEHGERLLQEVKIDEALKIFESILEKDPDNVMALNDKGVAYNSLERYEEAIPLFIAALQRDGNYSNAAFNLAANYLVVNNLDGAQNTLEEFKHCLAENDIRMITNDLRKLRSTGIDMVGLGQNHIVSFTINSSSCRYDLKIYLNKNNFSQKIIWNYLSNGQSYEPETSLFFECVLNAGDYIVDIGAHIGYFSILASKIVGENGTIFSFEPERNNYDQFRQNIELNDLKNIRTFNLALSSEDREGELFVNSDNDGGHALWDVSKHSACEKSRKYRLKQPVGVSMLDTILQAESVTKIKLIKIDTEGAEHNILRGAQKIIETCRVPFIICEINRTGLEHMGTDEDNFRVFMQDLGYETYLLQDVAPKLQRLFPAQHVKGNFVFNVVFIKPENLI
jgi:FkbM family methyltransferase